MNPLNEYPAARKVAYLIQWVANLATGILGIIFLNDAQDGVPNWFTVAGLVLAFVWTYTGLTAQQNVPSYRDVVEGDAPAPPLDRGAASAVTILLVAILVVVVLLFLGVGVNFR